MSDSDKDEKEDLTELHFGVDLGRVGSKTLSRRLPLKMWDVLIEMEKRQADGFGEAANSGFYKVFSVRPFFPRGP